MLVVDYSPIFFSILYKVKNNSEKDKIKNKIKKIINNPEIGKPMKYSRKGTREIYIGSFRLSYSYIKNENKLVFLDLYHKDEQ